MHFGEHLPQTLPLGGQVEAVHELDVDAQSEEECHVDAAAGGSVWCVGRRLVDQTKELVKHLLERAVRQVA